MTTLKKYKSKKISIPEFNKHIHPGDNFYLYINDNWLKHTSIPSHASSYSINEEIEDIIEKDLYNIIDKCYNYSKKGVITKSVDSQLKDSIGRFALSALRKSVQKNSIQIPFLVRNAIENKSIQIVGQGVNTWSNIHIDDLFVKHLAIYLLNIWTK
jgi:hypothetical protein